MLLEQKAPGLPGAYIPLPCDVFAGAATSAWPNEPSEVPGPTVPPSTHRPIDRARHEPNMLQTKRRGLESLVDIQHERGFPCETTSYMVELFWVADKLKLSFPLDRPAGRKTHMARWPKYPPPNSE